MQVTLTHPTTGFTGVITVRETVVLSFTNGTASQDVPPSAFDAILDLGILINAATGSNPPYDANLDAVIAPIVQSTNSSTSGALRAAFGSRRSVTVYDEFSRYADGPLSGKMPLVGGAWQTSGAQPTTVASGLATSTGTGYLGQILSGPVRQMACDVVFSGSGTDQVMTMIASTDSSLVIANAVHFNFGPTGFNLSVRKDAGSFDSLLFGNWVQACKLDGATTYRVAMEIRGNTVALVGPNGEPFAVTDPRVGLLAGSLAIWEPNGGTTTAGLKSVAAGVQSSSGQFGPLDLADVLASGMLAGQNGTAAGSRNTAREVSIGYDGGTGAPAVMFGPNLPVLGVLQSAVSVGATSLVLDQWLPNGSSVQIESGNNSETVTTSGDATGTGPYTAPVSATVKAHAAGVAVTATMPSGYQGKIYSDEYGGLHIPGSLIQGSGSGQFAFGGGPSGTGLYFGNAYDTGLFRVAAGVFGLVAGGVIQLGSGATTARPSASTAGAGGMFYDTTLHKPIWSDGTTWRDATGTAV